MNEPSIEQKEIINAVKSGKNVVVDACAGSGKSTTIISTAKEMPNTKILLITYNSSLKTEMRARIKELDITNIQVHTYHSLSVHTYSPLAHTDTEIRKVLSMKMQPLVKIKPTEIIVIDEAQDMTYLYYQLIIKYIRDMDISVQLLILGDYMQGLYEFKGADIRFLTLSKEIWSGFKYLKVNDFAKLTLKMSYRITNQMASFVNTAMLGKERLLACRDGPPVYYMRDQINRLCILVVNRIKELIAGGASPSDIFVLGASVKGETSNIRKIENILSVAGIPCHVPMFDSGKISDNVIDGKVVFSTFHTVKGRQRSYVFVVGFDHSYMTYYARNLDPLYCPNTLYVATTRATQRLFLLEHQNIDERPFKFLKMTHHEMKSSDFVEFVGQPQTIFQEKPEPKESQLKKEYDTTPTKLITFIPEHILEDISPILDEIFVVEQEPQMTIDIAMTKQTKNGLYEDVSDLNGIAIPSIYYDYLESEWSGEDSNILYDDIMSKMGSIKGSNHKYLQDIVNEIDKDSNEISDYLYLANVNVALSEKLYFKLKQIDRDEYDWISEREIAQFIYRMKTTIDIECQDFRPEIEKTVIHKLSDDGNAAIDRCLAVAFPTMKFRFTARTDLITEKTVWELKCTSEISQDHLLQVVIYAWIMRTIEPNLTKEFKIFNIRTGEIRRLNSSKEILDKIVILLLTGKYANTTLLDDATFIDNCRRCL